jgi:predicted permease
MNIAFIYPYAAAGYGDSGFTKVVFFDLGNIAITFLLAYGIACKYGSEQTGNLQIIKKILQSPPLWALGIGLVVNVFSIPVPLFIHLSIEFLARMTFPLIMISLGIIFSLRFTFNRLLIQVLLLRFLGGFIIGYLVVTFFSITGETRIITLLCCSAPVGMNTLIFATLTGLDTKIAANLVSLGIGLGMIFTTAIMLLAGL